VAQSGVSRHLRLLRDAGLVAERREGSFAFYSLDVGANGAASRVWASARPLVEQQQDAGGDLARLEDALRLRRERAASPFGSTEERLPVPGRSWIAWARALLLLVPPGRVADIGCGDGGLAIEMAGCARQVIAIDRSRVMLERAARQATRAGVQNIRFQEGELEHLPLDDGAVDLCLLSQILHHAAQPQRAVNEAARVLAPGGRVLILDLAPHQEEWVREIGDQWLGFAPEKLEHLLGQAGLTHIRLEQVPRGSGEPFAVIIATATKDPGQEEESRGHA
jgi:ArsR family transcriptional regulator